MVFTVPYLDLAPHINDILNKEMEKTAGKTDGIRILIFEDPNQNFCPVHFTLKWDGSILDISEFHFDGYPDNPKRALQWNFIKEPYFKNDREQYHPEDSLEIFTIWTINFIDNYNSGGYTCRCVSLALSVLGEATFSHIWPSELNEDGGATVSF